jgi:D-alanine-D-alanine ligase
LEEFHGVGTYDQHVVSYLELMRQPYTGCNPAGLFITHDKALTKKILTYHRIPTPRFAFCPIGRAVPRPKRLAFPLLVKSVHEDASLGIAQASIVRDFDALKERVAFIHERVSTHAIVEEYVEGRELYVGVIGNHRLQTFPVWELLFTKMPEHIPRIATRKVKWDFQYQELRGIKTHAAKDLPPGAEESIAKLCKRAYRLLNMTGYGRMDLRLRDDGRIFVIEANANPNLEYGEDFSESAEAIGISYEALMQRIINLGLRYHAPWKG